MTDNSDTNNFAMFFAKGLLEPLRYFSEDPRRFEELRIAIVVAEHQQRNRNDVPPLERLGLLLIRDMFIPYIEATHPDDEVKVELH